MLSTRRIAVAVVIPTVLLSAVLVATSCAPGPRESYRSRAASTDQASLHAVHSDRLHELMGDLQDLTFGRLPQEHDTEADRAKLLSEVVAVSDDLVNTADMLKLAMPELDLTAKEQTTFASLTDKLREQAQTLKQQGQNNLADELPNTLDQMQATCTACHSMFRG